LIKSQIMRNSVDSQAILEDYRWLVSLDGAQWLARAASLAGKDASLVTLAATLRQKLPAPRVHLLLEQLELRPKAKEKFPLAAQMFFIPLALEQATDWWVAAYKASRFPQDQPLADLCCGIGGDSLALAQRGNVRGVDRNPVAVILAEANVAAVLGTGDSCSKAAVTFDVKEVAEAGVLSNVVAWHIDPDRRSTGRRTTNVELHDPGPAVLTRMLSACPHAAIKLAPAADLTESWWREAELEWIGRGRQCRQLVAWFGSLALHPGRRRATVVKSSAIAGGNAAPPILEQAAATFIGEPNLECPLAPQIGRYVFEPDAAILGAKLEGALTAEYEIMRITPGVAYFTADTLINSPLLDCFEVQEVLPYCVKPLRQWLTRRSIGRLEVKKRGVPLDPEKVRSELLAGQNGDDEITLLLARVQGHITAILAKRSGVISSQ